MTVIAECTVRSKAAADLADVWPADLSIEIERVVPTGTGMAPYVIVWGDTTDEFRERVVRHPAIEDVELLDEIADRALYRVAWNLTVPTAFAGIARADLALLEAKYDRDGLRARVRARDSSELSAFLSYCRDNDIDVEVHRVYDPDTASSPSRGVLTSEQEDALRLAFARGYYDEDRKASLAELGAELGISRQAVSGRLRRGIRRLLADQLGQSADADDG